ncbi:MAG: DUF5103 domain-containing protein [Flavobacterium sp.]|nr:DUF5103 domain-containing protein [Flavobacterium sp.]
MRKRFNISLSLFMLFFSILTQAQALREIAPPYNIKTVAFTQNNNVIVPIFSINDSFTFEFDDLFGNEANYYYEIIHCNYNWTKSELAEAEYLQGFKSQRIQNYSNSFNTLQLYSHYTVSFPNRFTQFRVSGNYMINILNEDKEVILSRRFIVFEDIVQVPMQIRRARNLNVINEMHNVEFSIKTTAFTFQNPIRNVKVLLMQNGRFDNAIYNVKPQYTIGNDLIYKYDTETQFYAGNEFLWFENKDIRAANNHIAKVTSNSNIYNSHLYTTEARANATYTYAPDINGGFLLNNTGAENNEIEADYAWVFFSLSAPTFFGNKDIYINGMFNNYALTPENKMDYDAKRGIYEKAIMIKQGFTNYQYVIADANGKIDEKNAINGNFYQTENNYFALVYYRENNERYDRVIGRGSASSLNITN